MDTRITLSDVKSKAASIYKAITQRVDQSTESVMFVRYETHLTLLAPLLLHWKGKTKESVM